MVIDLFLFVLWLLRRQRFVGFLYLNKQKMEVLLKQNEEIKRAVEIMLEEIDKQKELNLQHEQEIETLLKFNERLLGIIENELNNKKDNSSLQPISERSERESDLIVPTLHSVIKARKFGAAQTNATKSERGYDSSSSVIAPVTKPLGLFDLEAAKSEINHSYYAQNLSGQEMNPGFKKVSMVDSLQESENIKAEISNEIKQIKRFKEEGTKFYDDKINQIRTLSSKLNSCSPMQQLSKISQKLTLSPATSNLISKALKKNK